MFFSVVIFFHEKCAWSIITNMSYTEMFDMIL